MSVMIFRGFQKNEYSILFFFVCGGGGGGGGMQILWIFLGVITKLD